MTTPTLIPECCRCCLVEDNDMIYVFDILDEFDSKICDLIGSCGGILIAEDDIFSKNICGNCLNDLANAARFRDRCLKTELILQNTSVVEKPTAVVDFDRDVEAKSVLGSEVDNDDYIEEIIVHQIEGIHEPGEAIVAFSDPDQDNGDDNNSNIEYIIAEDPTDTELEDFNYDNLIDSQEDELEGDMEGLLLEELAKKLTNDEGSFQRPIVEKEIKMPPPMPAKLNFTCLHCGAGFALQKNLTKHLEIHQTFTCDICLRMFESNEDLTAHCLLHAADDQSTESASDLPKDEEQRTAKPQNPKKNHICSYCSKGFVSNSALTSHVRVHTKEKPFPCKFCTKRFRTAGAQELHERRHNGVKPYKCDLCGRGFAESSNLKVHRRTHTKEKPHVCTVCNRAFARVFLLKIHQRTHTGERPFSCEDCGKPFSQQGDLAAHRRIHSGERPHRCNVCGKGFIKSSALQQHQKKHANQAEDARAVGVLLDLNEECDSKGVLPDDVGELIAQYDEYEISDQEQGEDVIETIVVTR